jgi:MFS family permease
MGTNQSHSGSWNWPLVRWYLAGSLFSVPQAAGPIAFALLALPLTGSAESGAAIVLALTLAQVAGAVPVARWGRAYNVVTYFRLLVAIRTVAVLGLAGLAAMAAPFWSLLAMAALAGSVNGAAFGYQRSVVNHLVAAGGMPRALGIAATLSEMTFVAAPVAASLLGTVDAVFGLLVLGVVGGVPALLMPRVAEARAPTPPEGHRGRLMRRATVVWLGATLANSAVVSSIEVGAVALAMRYGMPPAMGFVFTVALCAASVAGGVWVSVRNRAPQRGRVAAMMATMALGAALVAAQLPVPATVAAVLLVGCCMAPLSTAYSLLLDEVAAAHEKAELFALQRTMNAVGIIVTSATLSAGSLALTQWVAVVLMAGMAAVVAGSAWLGRRGPG